MRPEVKAKIKAMFTEYAMSEDMELEELEQSVIELIESEFDQKAQ